MPTAFVMLDKLPLLANGKVGPAGARGADMRGPNWKKPLCHRARGEEVVAGIGPPCWAWNEWASRITSLSWGTLPFGDEVVSRIQEAFQMELPLRHLFEWPTVAGLAESLGRTGGGANRAAPEHLEKIARVLIRLNQLSEEEAKTMLAEKSQRQLELVEE